MKITIPDHINFNSIKIIVVSILLAMLLCYPTIGIKTVPSILATILLTIMFYIIITSMGEDSNVLPSIITPYPPHMGLDGISMQSYTAGLSPDKLLNLQR